MVAFSLATCADSRGELSQNGADGGDAGDTSDGETASDAAEEARDDPPSPDAPSDAAGDGVATIDTGDNDVGDDPAADPVVTPDTADDGAPSVCPTAPGEPVLAVSTDLGLGFSTTEGWVVLTGTAPRRIGGANVDGVLVNDSGRGVAFDPTAGVWSYHGPLDQGGNAFSVRALAGAQTTGAVSTLVTLTQAPAPETTVGFGPGVHLVGTWFFPWFTGDTSWECSSPWWPVGGFAAWNGSVEWARGQLLDMMDANIDLVGLQYDTVDGSLAWGVRWDNVVNAIEAVGQLAAEGFRPPRLAMFFDTAIANQLYLQETGSNIDVSTTPGRDLFYEYVREFYEQVDTLIGSRYEQAAVATWSGRPMLTFWHTDAGSIVGASNAFVLDLKARFQTDFGVEPYLVAHPNHWSSYAATDEITLMFGPPSHFYEGEDTINITPGFWNPISNAHYLARNGGSSYDSAWAQALPRRSFIDHLYIDSWNETGEGSGIFAAQSVTYVAADDGACNSWVYRHDDSWGPSSRHFIDVTAANAASWNDTPADAATLIGHDIPTRLRPGERRWATVVLRNAGDRAWRGGAGDVLRIVQGEALIGATAIPIDDGRDEIPTFGGIFRGRPLAFTFELVAPCEAGTYPIELQMARGDAILFGDSVALDLVVED